MGKIIRNTKAYCSKCLKIVNSDIIEESGNLFIVKHCNKHKEKINLSNFSEYDLPLHNLFFKLGLNKKVSKRRLLEKVVLLYITLRCNLNCSMCSSQGNPGKFKEPTLKDIANFLKNKNRFKISLFGGEPTIREDIPQIIRLVKKTGNVPFLFTNGVKLCNMDYLKLLKKSGLAGVDFSFAGFDDEYYKKFRGKSLLKNKLKVFENLKKLNIETNLESVIIDKENTNQLHHILNYALENDFVNSVVFRPYNYLGRKGIEEKKVLNPTDLVNYLEHGTNSFVTKKKVFEFQRVLYIISDILNLRICSYNRYYLLFRTKNGCKTIHDMFPITKLQQAVDKYAKLKLKSRKLAKFYFMISFTASFLFNINIPMVSLALASPNIFLKNIAKIPKTLLPLKFTLNCDARIFDSEIVKNCTMYQYRNDIGLCTAAATNITNEINIQNKANNISRK